MIIVFLISLIAFSMNPETAVTFTRGHFNKVGFAVILKWMSRRIHVDTAFICYTLFI